MQCNLFWILGLALLLLFGEPLYATCLQPQRLTGVNMAGAAFGSSKLPGRMNRDYTYPKQSQLAYFAAKGANVIRLPIRWERIQRKLLHKLNSKELHAIKKTVDQARALDLCVLLDIHNYGEYHGQTIGSSAVPASAFIDLWQRLARAFRDDRYVAFDLMNEPEHMSISDWSTLASRTVYALRDAGANNLIMVAGGRWSGIHDWSHPGSAGVSNAAAFAALGDPLNRTVIEVHQYADQNYSGTHAKCRPPDDFDSMFAALTRWARANDQQLFLGEFGVPSSSECLKSLKRLVALTESSPVWRGWTYWAAGGWWGRYPLSVAPVDGEDAPQMAILSRHFFNNINHRAASGAGTDHD